jgi:hypothetical protein
MSTEKEPRTMKVVSDKSSACFKIQVGKLEISVITEPDKTMSQVILFSESGDQISERYISDFNELVSYFWKVERLIEDQ